MSKTPASYYETRLQREIEEIEARMRELTQEKAALQRQLMKARRENVDLSDVNRKNSVNRVMIETRVLDALKSAAKPMPTRDLYQVAQFVNFELNENTFRTTLHRMKQKALIEPTSRRGVWRLSQPKNKGVD